jgi:hypothetical protein
MRMRFVIDKSIDAIADHASRMAATRSVTIALFLSHIAVFGSCSMYTLDDEISGYLTSEYPGKLESSLTLRSSVTEAISLAINNISYGCY